MDKAMVGKILKFILLILLVAAVAFFVVNVIQYSKAAGAAGIGDITKSQMNSAWLSNAALCAAVLGAAVYLLLDILRMTKIGAFILIAAGVVAVVLLIVAIGVGGTYLDSLKGVMGVSSVAKAGYYGAIFTTVAHITVFGAAPIVFGITKLFIKNY